MIILIGNWYSLKKWITIRIARQAAVFVCVPMPANHKKMAARASRCGKCKNCLNPVEREDKMSESQPARTAGCRRQIRSGEDAKNDDVEEQMTPVSCRCKLIENLA